MLHSVSQSCAPRCNQMVKPVSNLSSQQILDSYRQLPYANTGCMMDRACDGCGEAGHADLSNSACANFVQFFVEELVLESATVLRARAAGKVND